MPNVIAVVGPFRSGTSCVAGMLHTLGVSMGRRFPTPAPVNSKGFFEAMDLRRICAQVYRTPMAPEVTSAIDFDQRVRMLQQHVTFRSGDSDPLGVKHPDLCVMVPEMAQAWPGVKVVSVTRSVGDVVASMTQARIFPMITEDQKRAAISQMISTRDADIERLNIPCLCLNYADVLADPQQVVDQLVDFVGISPTPEQTVAAVAFVDKTLCHFESSEAVHG
jgi:hypothetical protein